MCACACVFMCVYVCVRVSSTPADTILLSSGCSRCWAPPSSPPSWPRSSSICSSRTSLTRRRSGACRVHVGFTSCVTSRRASRFPARCVASRFSRRSRLFPLRIHTGRVFRCVPRLTRRFAFFLRGVLGCLKGLLQHAVVLHLPQRGMGHKP